MRYNYAEVIVFLINTYDFDELAWVLVPQPPRLDDVVSLCRFVVIIV